MQSLRLILMRHAKSDWGDEGCPDHDRTLNARGRRSAPQMAGWLAASNYLPDIIHASTARRGAETIAGMMTVWKPQPPVYPNPSLYLAHPEAILKLVRSDSLGKATVMLVAHNPGLQQLASHFAGDELDFPTAAIAIFDFPISDWSELTTATPARLIQHVFPKGLGT